VREGVADASVRFLQKPFSVEALAGAVREALDETESRGSRAA
jgi:FixJ family two-component response regulator